MERVEAAFLHPARRCPMRPTLDNTTAHIFLAMAATSTATAHLRLQLHISSLHR